jgi:hypothetical protein
MQLCVLTMFPKPIPIMPGIIPIKFAIFIIFIMFIPMACRNPAQQAGRQSQALHTKTYATRI